MTDTPELLTIAEAAARLGIGERRLRRLLAREENAARTVTVTRRTRTGTRTCAALPIDLLLEFQAEIERGENAANVDSDSDTANVDSGATNAARTRREPGGQSMALAAVYERVLRERERVIEAQAAQIETLLAALEAERESRRAAADALAREQTLRAIQPAPEERQRRRAWWPWRKDGRRDD
jgi:hypothetical protein